jgi:hypothetical protein
LIAGRVGNTLGLITQPACTGGYQMKKEFFMKNTTRILGIAVLVMAFGFAACGSPTGGGGTVDDTVDIAAILGVTAPATGVSPVTAITPTDQYTGTVAWNPAVSGTFAASTDYTATITLIAKNGFTLQGVDANFFTVAGATATNLVNSGTVTATFPTTGATNATPIDIAAITGVTVPVTGATPVTTITETAQYTGTVAWNGNPSTFAASTDYTATITLTAKAGFTLQGVGVNFFTVAGATATNAVNSGIITAVFPQTDATTADPNPIDIAAITGVTAPVTGATPVSTITETAQYTGTVTWNGSPSTFAASTMYTATITLTAKAGYTLTGVGTNFFTVAGATPVTYDANLGVITATFPQTAATISTAAITGVTPPAVGATPATAITETVQYTGTVTWNGSPATFAEGTAYTANIILTAKAGYTLHGVSVNFFTVSEAAATNAVNSGVITAVFPATPILVTGVTLDETLDLVVNDVDRKTSTLSAAVVPSTATNQNISWGSDNDDVATITENADGTVTVTAHTAGTATITVTTAGLKADNLSATASCTVTVKKWETFTVDFANVSDIESLTGPSISLSGDGDIEKTATLSVLNPEQYTSVIWHITGTGITVRGNSIELDSANAAYNRLGEHLITVEVLKNGIPFNRTVTFTVVE